MTCGDAMKRMVSVALSLIMVLAVLFINPAPAQSWYWCWYYGPGAYPEPIDSLPSFLSDSAYFSEPDAPDPFESEFRGGWLYTAIATEAGSRNYLQQGDGGSFYTVFSTDDIRGCKYTEWGAWQSIDFDEGNLRLKDYWQGESAYLNTPGQEGHLEFYRLLKDANIFYDDTHWNLDLYVPAEAKAVVGGFNDFGGDDDFDDLIFILVPDTDKDLIANYEDNCPTIWNENQINTDSDAFGNLCDNCPNIENDQSDSELDGCGIEKQDDLFTGIGVADIDGQIDADEWADAKRFYFNINESGILIPATLYVMNDARYLCFSIMTNGEPFAFNDEDIDVQGLINNPSRFSFPGQEYEASYNLFDDQDSSLFFCDQGISFLFRGEPVATDLTIQPAGDGVGDICDNCEDAYNPDQQNTDGDHLGDVCDNCPNQPNTSDADVNEIFGTCSIPIDGEYVTCENDSECPLGYCSVNQENTDFLLEQARDEAIKGDACDTDDDGDGMPDLWEILYPVGPDGSNGLDPYDPSDAAKDFDGDGLTNREEYENFELFGEEGSSDPFDGSTIPIDRDTDGDSWLDQQEKQAYLENPNLGDPTDSAMFPTGLLFSNGIYVGDRDEIIASDLNIGTKNYPLASIQAAVKILNKLEADQGPYTIIIAPGTYSGAGHMPNDNLHVKNDVFIQKEAGTTGAVIFAGGTGWTVGLTAASPSFVYLDSITLTGFDTTIAFDADGIDMTLSNVTIGPDDGVNGWCGVGLEIADHHQTKINFDSSEVQNCETGIVISGGSSNLVGAKTGSTGVIKNSKLNAVRFDGCPGVFHQNAISSLLIQNPDVEKGQVGIALIGGAGHLLHNNAVSDFKTGIVIGPESTDNVVTGGGLSANDKNFQIEGHGNSINNIIISKGADTGLGYIFGSNNQIADINLTGTGRTGVGVVVGEGAAENTLINVHIQNFNAGIDFEGDASCLHIDGSSTIHNCNVGLDLTENYLLDINLNDTQVYGCDTALLIGAGSANNKVQGGIVGTTDDIFPGNYDGVVFEPSCDATVEVPEENRVFNMHVVGNIDYGVAVYAGNANQIEDCTIEYNETGVALFGGSSTQILGTTTIRNNGTGVHIGNSAGNLISGTQIINNEGDGIAMVGGSGNQVLNSIVIGNDTGIYIGRLSVMNTVQGGAVQNNLSDNFWINGNGNTIKDLYLTQPTDSTSNSNGLGHISGEGNELINLNIVGDGTGTGFIVPGGKVEGHALTLTGFNVGVGFATDGACLSLFNSSINGCPTCETGILIDDKRMLDITLNATDISGFETGVKSVGGSSNNTIRGVVLEAGDLAEIKNNRGNGILFETCCDAPEENTITGLSIAGNGLNGVALLDGFNNVISTCEIFNNNSAAAGGYGGVVLMNGSGKVANNIINNNGCNGIYVDEATDVALVGNLIYDNKDGIRLGLTNDVEVASNTITDNLCAGLWIEDGSSPNVHYNIIYYNGETGTCADGTNCLLGTICADESACQADMVCVDENEHSTAEDIFLGGGFAPENLIENDIGQVNQIDLPPSNLSVKPKFNKSHVDYVIGDPDPYALQNSSFLINATTKEVPGFDILGLSRPKGETWDMGAYESSGFVDLDDDGLPDDWEEKYFGDVIDCQDCGADDDFDKDGVSNKDELRAGSDPGNPLYIEIVNPSTNPAFVGGLSSSPFEIEVMILSAPGVSLSSLSATINGAAITCQDTGICKGTNETIDDLAPGNNFIRVWATGVKENPDGDDIILDEVEDNATVIKDSGDPTVTIVQPTPNFEYLTALDEIVLSGFASDDTEIDRLTWRFFDEPVDDERPVSGAANWVTDPITLDSNVLNKIVITAYDVFGNYSTDQINVTVSQIALEAGVDSKDDDQSSGVGAQPPAGTDPRDADGDGYLNDDEIACGTDPLLKCPDEEACPANYLIDGEPKVYPDGHEKATYFWPNCLRDDIDEDFLPNWWETEIAQLDPENDNTSFDELGDDVPDGDENPDKDDFSNLEEYENGTHPHEVQNESFLVTVVETSDNKTYDDWLPQFGHVLKVKAVWTVAGKEAPAQAVFSLRMTSNYPGRAVNDPDPSQLNTPNYPTWYDYHGPDFGLNASDPASDSTIHSFTTGDVYIDNSGNPNDTNDGTYIIFLQCWDNGGLTKVLVRANDATGDNIGQLWVPKDDNRNGIAEKWDADNPLAFDPIADIDAIDFSEGSSYSAPLGDDFSNFEEYRGIVYTETHIPDPMQRLAGLKIMRLNPLHKDLFLRADGFDDAVGSPYLDERPLSPPQGQELDYYPFRMGGAFQNADIDVHNTTGWGHDATDDGSFYTYTSEGNITEIADLSGSQPKRKVIGSTTGWSGSWPKHEWEFQLSGGDWIPIGHWNSSEELYLNYSYNVPNSIVYPASYRIRKPVPHINVLLVRLDSTGDGHIQFLGASPPSQQNPTGVRSWRWATKGYAWTNLPADRFNMYGLAVALKDPLYNYFFEYPYKDGSSWNSSGWDDMNTMLDPLNIVEDQSDQLSPVDGIMGDLPNNNWDGDQRLPFGSWEQDGDLNPFDIDRDYKVELPVAMDPFDVDGDLIPDANSPKQFQSSNEYTIQEVLIHTTTHEIGHALGGPMHTSDPNCLMYKYSKNWSRADDLSDYFKSLLRIHNKTW